MIVKIGGCNIGLENKGNFNTGHCNTGNNNTGDFNTRNNNTGMCNKGNYNTGYNNIGHFNTGDCNTGSFNTGNWNMCSRSTGFFNTKESTVTIFNIDSGLTFNECCDCAWYHALCAVPFCLTEWVDYTDEGEKSSVNRGGYLKTYSFYQACGNWWAKMSDENKALIQTMPNFSKDIFKEITGIDV